MRKALLAVSLMALAGLGLTFVTGCDPRASIEQGPKIVIDGHFEDWDDIPISLVDEADPKAVICDFREVRGTSEPDALFLYVRIQHRLLLRVSGGSTAVLLDADGDPTTGWTERGMEGVDLAVLGRVSSGETASVSRSAGFRAWPPDIETPIEWVSYGSLSRMGIMRAPAFEADTFEIRIPRGVSAPDRSAPLLIGQKTRIKVLAELADGTIVDEVGPFPLDLVPYGTDVRAGLGSGSPAKVAQDPLARPRKTRLRVIEWNVSHRTLERRADQISRILLALRPDVALFNEVSSNLSAQEVAELLEAAGIEGASAPGHMVYGSAGGEERAVIAGRFPLVPVAELDGLSFPHLDLYRIIAREQIPDSVLAEMNEGIQTVGAVATVEGRRIFLASLGLESGGHSAFEVEELLRRLQAMSISSAMTRAAPSFDFDAVIVGGDFNLVVTERPLETIVHKNGLWKSPLEIINAIRLNGVSNATWSNPNLSFASGRLDFVMYGAPALKLERAFAFDSRDLSQQWLRHHNLSREISSKASDHLPIVADFSW